MNAEQKIVMTPGDDPEMDKAADLARKTFRFFWRELSWEHRRIIPGLGIAALKVAFSDPPETRSKDPNALDVEHMWLNEIRFDGKRLRGTLLNQPQWIKSVSEGDTVSFSPRRMTDWMYAQHDRVYGGFTVNLMRSRMSKGERKQHDNAWGLDFGDPYNVLVVPPDYLGEDEKKSGGLFSMFSKPKVESQDYARAGLTEHPMSVNMRESLENALKEDPTMANHADDELGFSLLHQLALAGSADGVEVAIQHGADTALKTKNGMTALELARVLGWKKVIALLEAARR